MPVTDERDGAYVLNGLEDLLDLLVDDGCELLRRP
jgi:hypothetical protein